MPRRRRLNLRTLNGDSMTCNRCSTVSNEAAKAVGAPEVEATWAENRDHPRFCPTCHGFLRRDGGCTKCENTGVGSDDKMLAMATTSPAPALSEQRYNPPFTDDEMREKLEELGITTVYDGIGGQMIRPQWGVPSKAGGIATYIGFSTDEANEEGPALFGWVLNKMSPELASYLFRVHKDHAPVDEYKPRIKALKKYIDRKLREARRNLPIKPNADLRLQNMEAFPLSQTNMAGADLRGANLNEADLSKANLTNADLRDANLAGADLRDANLVNSNFRDAYLPGANMAWARLNNADLSGADLSGADLSFADLSSATWDDDTVWPDNFAPETTLDDDEWDDDDDL